MLSAPASVRTWVERRYTEALTRRSPRRARASPRSAFGARPSGREGGRGPESLPLDPAPHVRLVRDRAREPACPRGRARGRRAARRGLQPALPPRPPRIRQDPPARRDRRLPASEPSSSSTVHYTTAERFTERVRRRPAPRRPRALQGALPRARRAADRRRPGARGQAAHRGGVRPHLQHAARRRQADRALERSPAGGALTAGRAPARPLPLGAAGRARAPRPSHPHRGALAARRGSATELPEPGVLREIADPRARERPRARGRDDSRPRGRLAAQRAAVDAARPPRSRAGSPAAPHRPRDRPVAGRDPGRRLRLEGLDPKRSCSRRADLRASRALASSRCTSPAI